MPVGRPPCRDNRPPCESKRGGPSRESGRLSSIRALFADRAGFQRMSNERTSEYGFNGHVSRPTFRAALGVSVRRWPLGDIRTDSRLAGCYVDFKGIIAAGLL